MGANKCDQQKSTKQLLRINSCFYRYKSLTVENIANIAKEHPPWASERRQNNAKGIQNIITVKQITENTAAWFDHRSTGSLCRQRSFMKTIQLVHRHIKRKKKRYKCDQLLIGARPESFFLESHLVEYTTLIGTEAGNFTNGWYFNNPLLAHFLASICTKPSKRGEPQPFLPRTRLFIPSTEWGFPTQKPREIGVNCFFNALNQFVPTELGWNRLFKMLFIDKMWKFLHWIVWNFQNLIIFRSTVVIICCRERLWYNRKRTETFLVETKRNLYETKTAFIPCTSLQPIVWRIDARNQLESRDYVESENMILGHLAAT